MDILLVTSREGVDRITSKILLKDVLILAVNKSSSQPQPQPQNTDKNGKGVPDGSAPRQTSSSTASIGTPSVVTVALTPYDAAKLIASTQIGQLQMLLRPTNDEGDHYVGYYVIPSQGGSASASAGAPAGICGAAACICSGSFHFFRRRAQRFSGIEVIRGTSVSRGSNDE